MIARGASLGFRLALGYGFMFILVGSVRYGGDLCAAPPDGSLWPTYLAGAISLAVASLGIALVLGVVAAAVGALTAVAAVAVNRWFNHGRQPQWAAAIGLSVALIVVVLLHLGLWSAGLWSWSSLVSSTYLFWMGIPAVIYLATAYQSGRVKGR